MINESGCLSSIEPQQQPNYQQRPRIKWSGIWYNWSKCWQFCYHKSEWTTTNQTQSQLLPVKCSFRLVSVYCECSGFFSVFRLQYHNTDCHTFNCYWVNPKTNTKSEPRFNAIGTNHLNWTKKKISARYFCLESICGYEYPIWFRFLTQLIFYSI